MNIDILKNVYLTVDIRNKSTDVLFLLSMLELEFTLNAASLYNLPCNKEGLLNEYKKGYYYIYDCTANEFDVIADLFNDYPFVELSNHYLYYEEETK